MEEILHIENLLSRADEVILEQLLGAQTIKLLRTIDLEFTYNGKFKELILDLHGKEKLLLNKVYRNLLFDLLKDQEAILLAKILGIYQNDLKANVYEKLKARNFRRGSNDEEILFTFFSLYPPLISKPGEVITSTTQEGAYQLFAHQRTATQKVKHFLNNLPNRVLLHMPTGSGKTRTAMNIIADHFRDQEPTLVIWLAASEELCEQAAEEFERAWSFLGNREIGVHRYWGSRTLDLEDICDGFVVAGLPKIVRTIQGPGGHHFIGDLARKTSLIVMDEAHQAIAETYRLVLDLLFYGPGEKKLLGLSATPGRTWKDIEADTKLASFFSKKKVKLEVEGYDNPIDYLTKEGYLAKVNYKSLFYEAGKLSEQDLRLIKQSNDIPLSLLNKFGEDDKRNLKIIYEAERLAENHKRIILFAPSVSSSDMLAFILKARGYDSYSLTSGTSSLERQFIIDDFKNEDSSPKILCNYGVLTTGFDAPQTSAAIIGRPTVSLVLYSQMVGRAIRGTRAGGNDEAEIVTIIDQGLPGFRSVAESFENWEDVWR